jgi:hypothetical protein
VLLAQLIATAAYLAPLASWLYLRLGATVVREDRLAIEIPVGVAADLVVVLLLTRVSTLERAALISRAGWLVAAGIVAVRRARTGRRRQLADGPRLAHLIAPGLVALGAVALSFMLSRRCEIWDREWHIPLVTSLRGQRLPFINVYLPAQPLLYHYAGDVEAAILQALSGGALHASLALSLFHDIAFALLAVNVVCFLRGRGLARAPLGALVFAATVLLGPWTLLRDDPHKHESGFALVNLLTLGFRPHVVLAYLLELGFLQLVVSPLLAEDGASEPAGGEPSPAARVAGLASLTAALAVTDETSLGLLGLGLGAVWLARPQVLAPTRRSGALALLALAATIVLALVLFGGALGPGAPRYNLSFVAPRAPGYAAPPLPLATSEGRAAIVQDLAPILALLGALALTLPRASRKALRGVAIFYATLAGASIVGLTCLDFEGKAYESHRFATAMFVAAPLVAALTLRRTSSPRPNPPATWWLATVAVGTSFALGIASTVDWLAGGTALQQCHAVAFYGYRLGEFDEVDCRTETGARLGESATPTYVDPLGFFLWSGCHPIFAAAPTLVAGPHPIKTGVPLYGRAALDMLRPALSAPTDTLDVACLLPMPGLKPDADPACARAPTLAASEPRGTGFRTHRLDPAAAARLSSKL